MNTPLLGFVSLTNSSSSVSADQPRGKKRKGDPKEIKIEKKQKISANIEQAFYASLNAAKEVWNRFNYSLNQPCFASIPNWSSSSSSSSSSHALHFKEKADNSLILRNVTPSPLSCLGNVTSLTIQDINIRLLMDYEALRVSRLYTGKNYHAESLEIIFAAARGAQLKLIEDLMSRPDFTQDVCFFTEVLLRLLQNEFYEAAVVIYEKITDKIGFIDELEQAQGQLLASQLKKYLCDQVGKGSPKLIKFICRFSGLCKASFQGFLIKKI